MSKGFKKIFFPGLLLIFLGIFSFTEVFAQGKIVGHVKNEKTCELLIGVNILIKGTNLGTASDLSGDYVIVNVPVGVYSLQASMIGYTRILKTNVVISLNQIMCVQLT